MTKIKRGDLAVYLGPKSMKFEAKDFKPGFGPFIPPGAIFHVTGASCGMADVFYPGFKSKGCTMPILFKAPTFFFISFEKSPPLTPEQKARRGRRRRIRSHHASLLTGVIEGFWKAKLECDGCGDEAYRFESDATSEQYAERLARVGWRYQSYPGGVTKGPLCKYCVEDCKKLNHERSE